MATAPTFSWTSDPRISQFMQPFNPRLPYAPQSPFLPDSMFGDAIAAARLLNIGPGTTGYGYNFGTGIIDTSIPEFNVDEGGGGEGDGGDGGRNGGGDNSGHGREGGGVEGRDSLAGGDDPTGWGNMGFDNIGSEHGPRDPTDFDVEPGQHDPEHGSADQRGGGDENGGDRDGPTGGVGGLAEGGIVRQPTRALIGEAGEPEAVIPQHMLNDPDMLLAMLRSLAKRSPLDDPRKLKSMSPRTRALWQELARQGEGRNPYAK